MICDACRKPSPRVGLVRGAWTCPACVPPVACETCGAEAPCRGLDRFAIGSADSDAYGLDQGWLHRCAAGHITMVGAGVGPGLAWGTVTSTHTGEAGHRVTSESVRGTYVPK